MNRSLHFTYSHEETFLKKINFNADSRLENIRIYGALNNIPIASDEVLSFLLFVLKTCEAKNALELGTAIGYSASAMLLASPNLNLTTLELNEDYANIASLNFESLGLKERAELILGDAADSLKILGRRDKKFDFVFVDAAKSHYGEYFRLIKPMLESRAVLFFDNILYEGLVSGRRSARRNNTIRYRMQDFIAEAVRDGDFDSTVLGIRGGVLLLRKR